MDILTSTGDFVWTAVYCIGEMAQAGAAVDTEGHDRWQPLTGVRPMFEINDVEQAVDSFFRITYRIIKWVVIIVGSLAIGAQLVKYYG